MKNSLSTYNTKDKLNIISIIILTLSFILLFVTKNKEIEAMTLKVNSMQSNIDSLNAQIYSLNREIENKNLEIQNIIKERSESPSGSRVKVAIYKYSKKYNIPVNTLKAVIYNESRFHVNAVNRTHVGLGQINYTRTGPWLHKLSKRSGKFSRKRLFDPDYNVELVCVYYKYLSKKYNGNEYLILKEYSGNRTHAGAQKYYRRIQKYKKVKLV